MRLQCSYCLDFKNDDEFGSIEHIWPQALGNKQSVPMFLTEEVCDRCNSLAGMHVDARFAKNWVVSNDLALASTRVLDPKTPSAAEFAYFGIAENFPCEDGWVCEHLAGPAGEHVYYVRPEGDDAWWAYVCGNPKRQVRRDARVYCMLTSHSEYWFHVFYHSVKARFKYEKIYCLTVVNGPDGNIDPLFDALPRDNAQIETEVEFILAQQDGARKVTTSMDLNFADRFMCKVALGLGRNLFGDDFLGQPLSQTMSSRLWKRDAEERSKFMIYGNPFDWEAKGITAIDFKASYVLLVAGFGGDVGVGLTVQHPSKYISAIKISENADDLSRFYENFGSGLVFVATPALSSFLGPFGFDDFIAHLIPRAPDIPELKELQARVLEVNDLPSRENSASDKKEN